VLAALERIRLRHQVRCQEVSNTGTAGTRGRIYGLRQLSDTDEDLNAALLASVRANDAMLGTDGTARTTSDSVTRYAITLKPETYELIRRKAKHTGKPLATYVDTVLTA
jgi:hypothetical protein